MSFKEKTLNKFGQNASVFSKIFYCLELDLIEFQFSGFFRIRVLAIFKDRIFSGSSLGKKGQNSSSFRVWVNSIKLYYLVSNFEF